MYTKTHKKELSMSDKLQKLLSEKDRKMNAEELAFLAASFRETMFSTLHARGTGHWGGSSSAAELVTALYFNRKRIAYYNTGYSIGAVWFCH